MQGCRRLKLSLLDFLCDGPRCLIFGLEPCRACSSETESLNESFDGWPLAWPHSCKFTACFIYLLHESHLLFITRTHELLYSIHVRVVEWAIRCLSHLLGILKIPNNSICTNLHIMKLVPSMLRWPRLLQMRLPLILRYFCFFPSPPVDRRSTSRSDTHSDDLFLFWLTTRHQIAAASSYYLISIFQPEIDAWRYVLSFFSEWLWPNGAWGQCQLWHGRWICTGLSYWT